MHIRHYGALATALLVISAYSPVSAADWPGWRGPQRDGINAETGLLHNWPEGGPPLVWEAAGLGEGFSTPSVAAGKLFVMGNVDGQEKLQAFDIRNRGELLWSLELGPVRHEGGGYPGPRCTPEVSDGHVYALGLNGDLICATADDGQLVWQTNLVDDFGGVIPNWGYAESVLIDGPWLVCTPGGNVTMVKLDKKTGKVRWEARTEDRAGYSSMVISRAGGVPQYVQFTADGVIGVSADTGELLWRYDEPANRTANCSTPLIEDNSVFAASGYGTGGGLVQLSRRAGEFDADEVYFTKRMKNHHGGMVLVNDFIYGANDPGVLTCLNLRTGDLQWQDREPGKCSVLYVEGKIIARSQDGPVSLVAANPKNFDLLGQFQQPSRSGQPSWPYPVVSDGMLYLRDQDKLLCYDLRAAQ